jgi:hypothetical protein
MLPANLRSMIFMANPIEALGIIPSGEQVEEEEAGCILVLWGPAPPIPLQSYEAYKALARKIAEKVI